MSTELKAIVDREAVLSYARRMNEPDWVIALREKGIEQAEGLSLPTVEKTRIDKWNLIPATTYREEERVSINQLPESVASQIKSEDSIYVQRNRGVVAIQVNEALQTAGVVLTDLQSALKSHEELVKKYLMKAISADKHRLTALHAATWDNGLFLYVPKNTKVEAPIQALFFSDEQGEAVVPHILIIADAGSEVTFVENVLSLGKSAVAYNSIVEVFVQPNAKVKYGSLHVQGENVTEVTYRQAIVEKDGRIDWYFGELNDGQSLSDNRTLLKGNGSEGFSNLVAIGKNAQKANYTQHILHEGLHSSSDILSRGVMKDEATAIFNGVTQILKGAQKSNGEQTQRLLMLSEKARGDANPILLIDEDDVKAGHAASVGQINQLQLYYLMSRGISRAEAERMIIRGFLAPVVEGIELKRYANVYKT